MPYTNHCIERKLKLEIKKAPASYKNAKDKGSAINIIAKITNGFFAFLRFLGILIPLFQPVGAEQPPRRQLAERLPAADPLLSLDEFLLPRGGQLGEEIVVELKQRLDIAHIGTPSRRTLINSGLDAVVYVSSDSG